MKRAGTVVAIALGMFASTLNQSFAAEWEIDKDHTNVGFTIRHLVSKVSGDFKDFSGKFKFDEKKGKFSDVNFNIKTASINTNNDKRDKHLRSEDFFNADKFPEMSFSIKDSKGMGKNKYQVMGDLTMRGVTKPVTLDVEYMGSAKDPWGNEKAGFIATAILNRKDFGIVWNKALDSGSLLLGEDVEVKIQMEANKK